MKVIDNSGDERRTTGGIVMKQIVQNLTAGLRVSLVAVALAAVAGLAAPASAQLVVDGEQIADAALLAAAKKEGKLLYYTVNLEQTERAALAEFKKDTGIDFDVVRLNGNRMYERVVTEFGGNQLKADLVSLSDFTLMDDIIKRKVLAAYRIPWWDRIPADLKDAGGHYYVQNRYAKVFGYNTKLLPADKAPKSWNDLLRPDLKGAVGIQKASSGGIGWTGAMLQRKVVAPDYWQKLAANKPKLYTGLTQAAEDVARGELLVSEMLPAQGVTLIAKGAPMALAFPAEGIPASAVLVGVTAVAQNPNAAKLYVNWVLSKRGGAAITRLFVDWATHPDVPPPSLDKYGLKLPPASALWTGDRKEWAELQPQWLKEWEKVFESN
jgi:iron(III) transport system substrate-binding protein